jgi:GST-like protein
MAYVLYGDFASGAFCIEAILAEAGAEYEFSVVSLERNEQTSPDYLAINPSGKIPALRLPDGGIATETAALILLLAERHPEARLLPPAGHAERAKALRYLAFMAAEIYSYVEICDYPERFVPAGEPAGALREKATARIRERMLTVEHAVAGPWFLASGFSALDLYATMFSRWRECRNWRETHLPKICAIAEAVTRRPAAGAVFTKHFAGR